MIRNTRQRGAIRQALEEVGRPLTPNEIHAIARRHYPKLGLRTVYRQIKDLVADAELVGIDYPGQPLRYELVTGSHRAHFICRRCDRLFSFPHEVPDVPVPDEPRFSVTGQETVFFGICSECGNAAGAG